MFESSSHGYAPAGCLQGAAKHAVRAPEADCAQEAPEAVAQPSEADRAREILSRYAKLDAPEACTAVAVTFSDDEAVALPSSLHQKSERQCPPLEYNSSSEDDGRQYALDGAATNASGPAVGGQAEAPLVALSAEQRGRKHALDISDAVDDDMDALRIEEGDEKLNLHRMSAGVDALGGFGGHTDTVADGMGGADGAGQLSVSAHTDDGSYSDSEGEAELLRTLLTDTRAATASEYSIASSSEEEDKESDSDGGYALQSDSEHEVGHASISNVSSQQGESEDSDLSLIHISEPTRPY